MALTLILAEKPSVGRNIAEALGCNKKGDGYLEGKEYIVTWAFGHLLTLYDCKDYDKAMEKWDFNNFPYIPKEFRYKVKTKGGYNSTVDTGAKKQLNIIKALSMRDDVEKLITATDFDREGEVIATTIYKYLNIGKPIYRILINEWTPNEIKKGLLELKENQEMKNLQSAGISRQWLDWVIGINLTTITTLKYGRGKNSVLNVGRVILPTLKMVYDREKQIKEFKPEKYFELIATFKGEKGTYEGQFFYKDKDKFPKRESLDRLVDEIKGKTAIVSEKNVDEKKEYPMSLFNLTNLQGFITSKYKGWTSDKVLKVAQSLYEKKLITYPRTSSTALEESIKEKAEKVLEVHKKNLPFKDEINFSFSKKVFNNKKVESHSAIIPTYIEGKNLTKDETIVYEAIKNRFLSQFMEEALFEITEIITMVKGENYDRLFKTKGKVLIKEGWMKLYDDKIKEELLPSISKGEQVEVKGLKIQQKSTKAPAHLTEKTLLKAMETCGKNTSDKEEEAREEVLKGYSIGTAATRADTIKKLKEAKYMYTKGKSILITEKGQNLIEIFPIKELLDTDYTGRMEKALFDIEKGQLSKDRFLTYIFKFTRESVVKIKQDRRGLLIYDGRDKDKVRQ